MTRMDARMASLDRSGWASLGLVLGGLVVGLGAILAWIEAQAAATEVVAVDEAGSRVILVLAAGLVAFGTAMLRPGPRRRWWRWAMALAVLGLLGLLANWVIVLVGADWSVTWDRPEPDRFALGLPVSLVGCLIATVSAVLLGRSERAAATRVP